MISSQNPELIFEGLVTEFFSNGKKKSVTTYQKGIPIGKAYTYYPNGRKRQEIDYLDPAEKKNKKLILNYKLAALYDTLGVEIVKNGSGYAKFWNPEHTVYEEGMYKNGLKDSIWKTIDKEKAYSRTDKYKSGVFISGTGVDINGITREYSQAETAADFRGGVTAFLHYFSKSFNYPVEARNNGVQGRCIVSFTIEPDGSLANIAMLQKNHPLLEEEIVRVLKKSPKWLPGYQFGYPVRTKYTLPVNLSLH